MKKKPNRDLTLYYRWPFIAGVVFVPAIILSTLFFGLTAGAVALGVTVVYYLLLLTFFLIYRKRVEKKLVGFAKQFSTAEKRLTESIDVPSAFVNEEGTILWENRSFRDAFYQKGRNASLKSLFPETEETDLLEGKEAHVHFDGRSYRMETLLVPGENSAEFESLSDRKDARILLVYLTDETDLLHYKKTLAEETVVLALLYFDNFEEVMSGIEDVRKSLLSALLERKLNKHFSTVHAIVRKLEKDRYFVIMNQKSLWQLEERKFPLMEDVKTVSIGNEMPVTVSVGVGLGGDTFEKNFEYARAAIDMALGRGGDQVVIKNRNEVRYYGGKAQSTERNTRVKARTKAHALRELIEAKDHVLIMGHPISDLDCLGAAMGIYRAAVHSDKTVNVVIGEVASSVQPVIQMFQEKAEYGDDLFISPEEAKSIIDRDTLLVVVDTDRPSYTVCPELLTMASSIVVIDHHRQGREIIENAELSYVEPFASSASEMVAEIVQYYDDNIKLKAPEADAVFAGIVMDTNNFEDKAGVRTFEAAAYLRRCGADVTRVRKLFRDSMQDYKLRAETVNSAEPFGNGYIIAVCPSKGNNPNQTVVAAQAANELLEIKGIRASFVLTEFEHKIFISARSIDEVNVQVMMEKLGGGGHLSVAGAQFTGITMEEALERLKAVIEEDN